MQTDQPQYSFGWQGGEPTLMGVDFFRRAVEFQQKYGRSGVSVGNGLQTNATLITDEMAALFAQYSFLLGVSLDGPEAVHDKYRKTLHGQGSHAAVMAGIQKLQNRKVEFNILVLVSESNVKEAAGVYHYLCDHGFLYHQYIPCVEPDENRDILPFSINGEAWGEFLCTLFDQWYAHDTRRVSIRLFDSILALMVDRVRNICHFGMNCCQYFVVEYNGDIYPCDFFVEKPLLLGNITHQSWATLQNSPLYQDFGRQKMLFNPICGDCEFGSICVGDCLKHRLCSAGGDPRRLSHLCAGWKMFFKHTLSRFQKLAQDIQRERMYATVNAAAQGGAAARNSLCPCGSGRKFKKCCGRSRK